MKKTTHLELNKPELTDYVNVEDLNENADIIDEAINENKERLATHLADLASQEVGKGADTIGLPDPNNLFDATDIGGAMQELFINVSDGKNDVATAITGKGVVTSGSDTFQKMAINIENIKVGDYSVGDKIPGMKIDKPAIGSQYQHKYNVIPEPKSVTGRGIYGYYSSNTVLIKVDASRNSLEIWRLSLPTGFGPNSIGCDDEGELFIYHAGELSRKNPFNGDDIWTSKNPSFVFQNTMVNRILFDKDFVYVATDAKAMTKFRKTDGSVVWSCTYDVNLTLPTRENGYIYFSQSNSVYSISTSTGRLQAVVRMNNIIHNRGAVIFDDKVYAQSQDPGGRLSLKRFSIGGLLEKESAGFQAKSFFVISPYGIWVSLDGAYAQNLKLLDRDLNEVTRGYQYGDNSYGGVSGRFYSMEIDKDGNLFYIMGTDSSICCGRDFAKNHYNIL